MRAFLETPQFIEHDRVIDAMGTQSKIVAIIRDRRGDYILALKGNQSSLHENVARFFEDQASTAICVIHKTTDLSHGRIEERMIRVTADIAWLRNMHP